MIRSVLIGMFLAMIACQSDVKPVRHIEAPDGMVYIPGGELHMGGDNDQADDNEYPKHTVQMSPFYMDATEVTNAEFMKFVEATGYQTVAERAIDWEELKAQLPPDTPKPPDSVLMPGALVFTPTAQRVSFQNPNQWWRWQVGADWQHPTGPESSIVGIMDHPVVQIAWEDATAYADWAKKRLPTEAEWEWAARGGLKDQIYPWGDQSVNDGPPQANFYQGLFPIQNTAKDGYVLTAPVKSFEPNGYGLYDMAGNVWEWCSDWFDVNYYGKKVNAKGSTIPDRAFNPMMPYQQERVIRGGSFLCTDEYCSGYRNARRMGSTADTGLNHTGFRCTRGLE